MPVKYSRGFTLLELMIIVVIVGILASIAYPSYREYMLRSGRAEARSALLDLASRQEQYFLDNKTYTTALSDLALNGTTEHGKYAVAVDAATGGCPIATCYSATATPQGGQTDDLKCAALTLDSSGTKGATGTTPTACW